MAAPQKITQGSATPISSIPFFPKGRHLAETLDANVFTPVVVLGDRATYILVQAIAENIRFTIDPGQPPSATIGFQLLVGDQPLLIPIAGESRLIRFIREANGAILQYQFGTA